MCYLLNYCVILLNLNSRKMSFYISIFNICLLFPRSMDLVPILIKKTKNTIIITRSVCRSTQIVSIAYNHRLLRVIFLSVSQCPVMSRFRICQPADKSIPPPPRRGRSEKCRLLLYGILP